MMQTKTYIHNANGARIELPHHCSKKIIHIPTPEITKDIAEFAPPPTAPRKNAGTFEIFSSFINNMLQNNSRSIDFDKDPIKFMLVNNLTRPNAGSPQLDNTSHFSEVSGKGYKKGGKLLNTNTAYKNNVFSVGVSNATTVWNHHMFGVKDIQYGIVYCPRNDALIGWMEMSMGGQPISLQDGDITINWTPVLFSLDK